MNEAQLLSDLESANLGFDLVFQVSYSDTSLIVVINRPELEPLDYGYMKDRIFVIIEKNGLSELTTIYFYSRILGVEETDWQDQISITKATKPSLIPESKPQVDATKATVAIADQEVKVKDITPKDLSQYRFGLSDYLIETIAEPPESEIAEIVCAFDQLSQTNKLQLLPALEQFFVNQDRNAFEALSSELGDFGQKIEQLSNRKRRSASIWLARYCVKGDEILAIVTKTLPQPTETSSQAQPETSSNSNPSSVTSSLQSPNSVTTNSTTREPRRSSVLNRAPVQSTNSVVSSTSNSNLLPMAIALLVVGLLGGWAFGGALRFAGAIAVLGFSHGFVWAVGVSYGNKLFLGSTPFNILIIIFFRGYFWSQGIGIVTGFAFATAIKLSAKSVKDGSLLFGKKGLIGFVTVLIGLLIGIGLLGGGFSSKDAIADYSGEDGNRVTIVEGEIMMQDTRLKKKSLLTVGNRTSTKCQLSLQSVSGAVESAAEETENPPASPTIEASKPIKYELKKFEGLGGHTFPLDFPPGFYKLFCEENNLGGASFEIVP
jgi:hypothetical protein